MSKYKSNIILPDFYDSQVEEKKIFKFWQKNKIFDGIQNKRSKENSGKFSIHSGPIFPTGSPHSGHFLNSVFKDAVLRYSFQRDLQVETRFGWDCHGVPVEHEVEKRLGITCPEDVQAMGGVAAYNEECRKFVQRNIAEWKPVFERVGNWIDYSVEYQTMSPEYMESVWWVFKELYEKGLVYKAKKVLPYSTACRTHLSNFEAEQNLKEVTEVGTTISVNIVDSDEKLLIWTTTPLALVSNSAICVNPKTMYAKVKMTHRDGREVVYIVSKNRVKSVFKNPSEYVVLDEFLGAELQDLKYEPLFEGGVPAMNEGRVLLEDGVPGDVGSGLIPLDEVLIESLKERGHVFGVEEVKYKKPYCWRSDTPLVRKQIESWFIRVEGLIEKLLENSTNVGWFPDEELKEKNFTKWLKDHCTDWVVGRTRLWGTPIPIWSSPSGDEVVCVGSIEELKKLTGKKEITSIYKECLDWLVIPSRTPGNPPLRRVPEVLDCWFESGALPFAHGRHLGERFEVDLVVEGIDQSRGWFYTMLVLSTALSKPAPFLDVVATGLVLGPDGSKMTKRKHNNHEPMRLIEKYGADAVRLYLLSTPALECQDVALQEKGVAEMVKSVIEPLYRIFQQTTSQLGLSTWENYGYVQGIHEIYLTHCHAMDVWIWTYTESILKAYHVEMAAYRLPKALKLVMELIRQVEEWYLPYFAWTPDDPQRAPLHSSTIRLYNVIYRCCLMLAPFAPHFTEYIYQFLRDYMVYFRCRESIHDCNLLPGDEELIKPEIVLRVSRMQRVVELVRELRARHIVPTHYLISEVVVVHYNESYRQDVDLIKDIIMKLTNTQNVRASSDPHEFRVTMKIELKKSSAFYDNHKVTSYLHNLDVADMESQIRRQHIPVDDFQVTYEVKSEGELFSVIVRDDVMVVIKMNKCLSFYEEGTLKELAGRIRRLKKKANYYHSDFVVIYYVTKDKCLENVVNKYREHLKTAENCNLKLGEDIVKKEGQSCVEETVDIKGLSMQWHLYAKCC